MTSSQPVFKRIVNVLKGEEAVTIINILHSLGGNLPPGVRCCYLDCNE